MPNTAMHEDEGLVTLGGKLFFSKLQLYEKSDF